MTEPNVLTTKELLARGWTRTLIKRFLQWPDGCRPVRHFRNFRGQDVYAATRVWNVEQSDKFGAAFLKSWKGRMKGCDPSTVLSLLREDVPPLIQAYTKEEMRQATVMVEASGLIAEARARGYRTPHKC
jgi:hypothetical protein